MMRQTHRIFLGAPLFAGLSLAMSAIAVGQSADDGVATNPISRFPITVDGLFTDGVAQGEWSDVTPLAFISPATSNGTLFRTSLTDPNRNSLLYAAIAPGASIVDQELYLMYDYLPRTNPNFFPGEFIADIGFPIKNAPGHPPGESVFATVHFRGAFIAASTAEEEPQAAIPNVAVFVTLEGSPTQFAPEQLGMQGAVDFGPSTLSSTPHMLVELEVSLNIPAGFLGPNSPPGNGVYSPEPAFWGAEAANDIVDPPASAAIFEILPGGVVIADSRSVTAPEPATAALAALAAIALGVGRRRAGRART